MAAWLLAPILFVVAAAYASVGLGGGTAYLSVMSFWTVDPDALRPLAWGLNVVVAAVGFRNFRAKGHFDWHATWHYLLGGIAGGAAGALIPIGPRVFAGLLAAILLALGIRMLLAKGANDASRAATPPGAIAGLALGGAVGVLSGVVGIGGGIVLGPIVISLGLLDVKRTAALTSLYILVVSAGALASHVARGGPVDWRLLGALSAVVVVGGYLGSRYGAGRAEPVTLQRLFSAIVLIAGARLVWRFVAG